MKAILPLTNLPRVVIIGGGFGGIKLAQGLKKAPFQVVMLDRHNYHTFQPLLYQVSTGGLEPDSIAFPLRKMFAGQDNFIFRIAEVSAVDPAGQVIQTSIGEIEYDYLVIATGSKTNYFGLKEVEAHAMGMKTIPESLNLRSLILQHFEQAHQETDVDDKHLLMKFVVVGGGPTGVETAGALAELKRHVLPNDYPELDLRQMEIHLVEAGDQLLGNMTDKSSEDSLAALEKLGVHVWLDTRVTGYDGRVVTTDKTDLQFDAATLIWAAGIMGNVPEGLPKSAFDRGTRLAVDAYNRVIDHPRIFAIGDAALMRAEAAWPNGHPQVAPAAMQQGTLLAANLINLHKGAPLKPFVYFDKGSMATIGRNKAVMDFGALHLKGLIAWLGWMFVHLLFLIGMRNRLVVLTNWIWSYFTYDKGNRLIIRPYQKNLPEETPAVPATSPV
ncbi:MAG: NAD(P)/FAD-dependent oxidoreductase [Bacteroidia bacterium]|nr:NAD(P)/FAD-dependent oxidoreductase [Bacteroidia bacterium]